jgi:hypothetical protein
MIAGAANATLIGLEWADTPGQSSNPIAPNTDATVQMWMSNGSLSGDDLPTFGGIGLIINAWADPACTVPANDLFQVSVNPLVPGWIVAPANQNEQLNDLQWAAVFGPDHTPGVGKEVLLQVNIQYFTATPLPEYYLTIKRDITPIATSSVIFDASGGDYVTTDSLWDSRYAEAYGASYWAFGDWGNRGWSRIVKGTEYGQPEANPLILVTPEPASLALLALGGFAALRRR